MDWDSAAEKGDRSEMYFERMRPFEGTARMPLYPTPRFLDEKMEANFRETASAVKDQRWELMFKPRGVFGAASQPFARVPNHNNELLLLL